MIGSNTFHTVLCSFAISMLPTLVSGQESGALHLYYDKPAEFFEEALVLGNGTFGATVYGGIHEEKISLNDLTLWTGEPSANDVYSPDAWKHLAEIRRLLDQEDYVAADKVNKELQGQYTQNYQPLGNLLLSETDIVTAGDYKRVLDLPTATASISYGDRQRSYFVSAPDSVMVIRLSAENQSKINMRIGFSSLLPISKQCRRVEGKMADMTISGYTAYTSSPNYAGSDYLTDSKRGIHFCTIIRVIPMGGGTVQPLYNEALMLSNCSEAIILVANVTSFNGAYKDPVTEGRDYVSLAKSRIDKASKKDYSTLYDNHITDFGQYFNRVSLDWGTTDADIAKLPTDVQLKQYTELKQYNPDLEELYCQYGRYLLISCSRTQGVPANLQGLWNEHLLPPWSCNYTTNINLEENYWLAETANLSEMHQPMLDFVQQLPKSGAITARNYYNVQRGWCLGHNSDIWGLTNPVGRREGDPGWASWNMGGAWVSTHLWEHYQFTQDKAFLQQAYNTLKGAAYFCIDWLISKEIKGNDGKVKPYLLTAPCTSPENRYFIPESKVKGATFYGGFADLAMIRECLLDTRAAAEVLGIDKAYRDTLTDVLAKLLPYRIGNRGNLQEFFHDWEGEDPQHRHQSHLFGLYPGHHISIEKTPELAKACAKSLQIKGPKSTGWSTGWRINLQARLRDADMAYRTLRQLLTYISPNGNGGGTYPNLLDAHSPFQIDGNFGGTSGIIEMLVQSTYEVGQTSKAILLPAIPESWSKNGSAKGLCLRGGFKLDFAWKEGRVVYLQVTSRRTDVGKLQLCCGDKKWKVSLRPGQSKIIVNE